MTIKRRVRLLECWQRPLPLYVEPRRYTRGELRQMSVQELSRLYWETFRQAYQGPQVDDAGSKRRREELRRMPLEELTRRYRESVGEGPAPRGAP